MSRFDRARAWLAPPEREADGDVLWRWSRERDALVWPDGSTAVLVAELLGWVRSVVARGLGLPELDAIVVALGTIRQGLRLAGDGGAQVRWLAEAQKVWAEVRDDASARRAFLDWALAAMPTGDPETATAVRDLLADGLTPAAIGPPRAPLRPGAVVPLLGRGLAGITVERVRRLARSGVADAPRPSDDMPWDDFVAALARHPRTRHVATAARGVAAAVCLRAPLARQPAVASGGTAGLANRGPLERLAISELAHDDDVLTLRLALGEALHTEPERPPEPADTGLRIVVEAGVAVWGGARHVLLGAAAALARRSGRSRVASGTFVDGRWVPTDLCSVEGIDAHLEILDRRFDIVSEIGPCLDGHPQDDWVLCVALGTAMDPAFRAAVPVRLGAGGRLVFGADAGGRCRFWAVGAHGWRLEREFVLGGTLERVPLPAASPSRHPAYFSEAIAPLSPGRYGERIRAVFVEGDRFGVVYRGRCRELWLSRAGHACFTRAKVEAVVPFVESERGVGWWTVHEARLPHLTVWLDRGLLHFVGERNDVSLCFDPSGRPLVGWAPSTGVITGASLVERIRRIAAGDA